MSLPSKRDPSETRSHRTKRCRWRDKDGERREKKTWLCLSQDVPDFSGSLQKWLLSEIIKRAVLLPSVRHRTRRTERPESLRSFFLTGQLKARIEFYHSIVFLMKNLQLGNWRGCSSICLLVESEFKWKLSWETRREREIKATETVSHWVVVVVVVVVVVGGHPWECKFRDRSEVSTSWLMARTWTPASEPLRLITKNRLNFHCEAPTRF